MADGGLVKPGLVRFQAQSGQLLGVAKQKEQELQHVETTIIDVLLLWNVRLNGLHPFQAAHCSFPSSHHLRPRHLVFKALGVFQLDAVATRVEELSAQVSLDDLGCALVSGTGERMAQLLDISLIRTSHLPRKALHPSLMARNSE